MAQTTAPECATWTVSEAAAVLGVSRTKMYELVASGVVPHLRAGRVVRIPKRSLEDWLEQASRLRIA